MSLTSDLAIAGAVVGGLYLLVRSLPDVAGGVAQAAGQVGEAVYQSGAQTGQLFKIIMGGNLANYLSPVKPTPSQETIELEAQAGFYYDPITVGFLPVGYTWEHPEDPFHSKLIKVS